MKRKDKDELKGLKPEELKKRIDELTRQIRDGVLDRVTKEVKNKRIVKELRKKRAVGLSVLRIKTLSEGESR